VVIIIVVIIFIIVISFIKMLDNNEKPKYSLKIRSLKEI
jgi:hypothetical protein